MRSCLFRILSA